MSTALWTAQDSAAATGGRATSAFAATGVSIDSRTVQKGDLFVALKGPNHDGHDHVASALAAGAAAAMVAQIPADVPATAPLLVVADTLRGLEGLGGAARARSRARVAAVTGSVGKTSTKEALRLALDAGGRPKRPTHASAASFNNHIGVPLTLARLPGDAEFAVFEIGMNHAGEITPLTKLVRPNAAIITTVEGVHTENFADGIDGVAAAKAEIFEGFGAGDGVAVLNRDNRFFDVLAERARARGAARVLGFGADARAEYRLAEFKAEPTASTVTAEAEGRRLTYRIGAPGRHWAFNTLAVLAACDALGVDIEAASAAFATFAAQKGRGQRHRIALAGGAYELIDDSYNASPVSMRASFEVLKAAAPGPGGRRIAVLGDMLELGLAAAALHADLAEPLAAAGVDLVFTCGAHMQHLHDALPPARRGGHA
ncbi:MAG: UDP-N-acetylmuramoyl-tripeptide--D-alanyl-D-alanine ligase, partial [Alphaproteobacteria bacterium]|nr:UDP-N-acetylmuramoyl-tripeptide--D-alanyl-D-alanine ligase [Alphaproteobacteria bacterium]